MPAKLTIFVVSGAFGLIAEVADPSNGFGTALVQFGAIGVILAWITMVDIPQRNKAAEKREETWLKQVESERTASIDREAILRGAITELAHSIDDLAKEIRENQSSVTRRSS